MKQREIKFRAWDCKKKCWVYYLAGEPLPLNCDDNSLNNWEFIGLKDKNGIEIYEGDKTTNGYVIMWSKKHALFCEHYYQSYFKKWTEASYPIQSENIQVIGNIYEHK